MANEAQCTFCIKEISAELTTIKKHAESQQHKKYIRGTKLTTSNLMATFSQAASSNSTANREVASAEIKLCGFLVEHNIAFSTMDNLTPLLISIFLIPKLQKVYQ